MELRAAREGDGSKIHIKMDNHKVIEMETSPVSGEVLVKDRWKLVIFKTQKED